LQYVCGARQDFVLGKLTGRKWTSIDYKSIPYAAVTSFRFTNFRPLPPNQRSAIPAHRYAYLFTRATSKRSHYGINNFLTMCHGRLLSEFQFSFSGPIILVGRVPTETPFQMAYEGFTAAIKLNLVGESIRTLLI
jgi:hypothetical protein